MSNQKQAEVQKAFQKQGEEIDRRYFRHIKREMYECSAKCCTNTTSSMEEVAQCVDGCSKKFEQSHNYVLSQFNNYQERLHRCVSQCNDEAQDRLGHRPSDSEVSSANKLFEKCAGNCIDSHIELLPSFMMKVHEFLSSKMPPQQCY